MNTYEAKQEARRERYEAAADRAEAKSTEAWKRGSMSESNTGIPFGQPILVGHHSEKRHRAAIRRSDNAMRKGHEEGEKAKHYRGKAHGVGKGGISSDDPEAVVKLKEQLAKCEANQEQMKTINKAQKAGKLADFGYTVAQIERINTEDFAGRTKAYPSYMLSNNNANIRRIKERIKTLEASAERTPNEDKTGEGWTLVENVEENRIQFLFDGKPSADIRSILKGHAFRWAPSQSAWQRHLNGNGQYAAACVIKKMEAV